MAIGDGRILLIEDDSANIEMLNYLLTSSGFEMVSAVGGEAGITKAVEARPDIILLDIMMPGIDGFETCRRLKAIDDVRDIPVIFLTARSDIVDKVKGFEVGAVDYITKPFQYEEVIARCRSHIIMDRQRREIERLRDEDRLYYEKLSEIKDDVLNTATHDLKNPLNVIMTSLYLLRRHGCVDDAKGEQLVNACEISAKQMRNLIADLLDLARIETGQGVSLQDISLNSFCQSMLDGIAPLAQEKQIALRFSPLQPDYVLSFDVSRMGRVLDNLLSNAVKYTPSGGNVELSVQMQNGVVLIQIIDDGLGIPEDDLPHVFDKFYRIHREEYLAQEGTGLGLSIVKSIVERHGGEIWVESELDKGTTFSIALPA